MQHMLPCSHRRRSVRRLDVFVLCGGQLKMVVSILQPKIIEKSTLKKQYNHKISYFPYQITKLHIFHLKLKSDFFQVKLKQ